MDEHVPFAITHQLRGVGVDVLTVQEDGRGHSEDSELLDRAEELGREMVTMDEDFLKLASMKQRGGEEFCGVFFGLQIGGLTRRYAEFLEVYAVLAEREEVRSKVFHMR